MQKISSNSFTILGRKHFFTSDDGGSVSFCFLKTMFVLDGKEIDLIVCYMTGQKLVTSLAEGSLTVWALYAYFSDSQYAAFELLV